MDDIPYLLRGISQVSTASSTLVSSSRYLNSPRLREWVATELLRRNGSDVPTPSGAFQLSFIIKDLQDYAHIDALLEAERARLPALDRFLAERFVSSYTKADLAKYPPGSVAGLFYKQINDNNYQVNIVPPYEAKGHYDHWLCAPARSTIWSISSPMAASTRWARWWSGWRAWKISTSIQPGTGERTGGHAVLCLVPVHLADGAALSAGLARDVDSIERGRKIGLASDPYVIARYEDVFHLTPAEAREVLGVREVDDKVDTTAASRIWDGRA